jgi:integrase
MIGIEWYAVFVFDLGYKSREIANLRNGDLRTEGTRPHIRIRVGAAKGGRPRMVPLWWDAGTLEDLRAWKRDCGGEVEEPFIAPLHDEKPFSRHTLRKRNRTACRVLGAEQLETLTIHHGRHTFISHPLAGGRTLAEVRDAVGHANVSITSGYLHVAVEDDAVWRLFG